MTSTLLRGAEHPRIDIAPTATDTRLGEIAATLSARAGLPLEPWQVNGLRSMLARRDDGKWAAFEYGEICARQNGKTAMFMARAFAGLFLLEEETILWSAHEVRTAMQSWRKMRAMLRTLGVQVNKNLIEIDGIQIKVIEANGEQGFERLDTGQVIKIVARSKGGGRGFSADFIFIDEAFAYEATHQDALMPTLIARPNAQIGYASSPPLTGLTGGPMYSLRKRAESGTPGRLAWRDWGLAVELDELLSWPPDRRKAFFRDSSNLAATNPGLGLGRVTEETIEILRDSMTEAGYAREVLGCWPKLQLSSGTTVIDPTTWAACGDPGSKPGEALVFGIDASPGGRSAAIASSGRREDERLHVKVIDYRPGTAWVAARAKELVDRFSPRKVMVHPGGPAGALLADLAEAGVEVELVGGQEMPQACGALVNDLTEDKIRHTGQDALNDAVAQATARNGTDGTWKWDRRDSSGDICPLVAVTVAAHGFRLFGSESSEPVLPLVAWR